MTNSSRKYHGKYHEALHNVPTSMWFSGEEIHSNDQFEVINPGNGEVLTTVDRAQPEHALEALGAAYEHKNSWARVSPKERSHILYRAYEIIQSRKEELAIIMTLELGRTLEESRGEVNYGSEYFRWFAGEAERIYGSSLPSSAGNGTISVIHQPVGVALAITPWNFPFAMGARKIAPALAAGCPIIVKPAEDTPLTMLWLARVLHEAGLPAGVLFVLPTDKPAPLTEALMRDPRLAKLTFTGSTAVGKLLLRQASDTLKRSSMELGGNAPVIVFPDADLDQAVQGTFQAKMRNGGQACTAANRIFVHKSLVKEFVAKLVQKTQNLQVGPGWLPENTCGSIVNEKQLQRIAVLVDSAVAQGAQVECGGSTLAGPGYFYEPTVLTGVTTGMKIAQEEIFGPVASIIEFDSEEEVVAAANDTPYGLASYFFTKDAARMQRVSVALDYGMVGVNKGVISDPAAPFGGWKESGLGREGGSEGIYEYVETKYIASTTSST